MDCPLMILRPALYFAHEDLNQAYLLSEMMSLARDTAPEVDIWGNEVEWYEFDLEYVARCSQMPISWVARNAVLLAVHPFFACGGIDSKDSTYPPQLTRPVLAINVRLLLDALKEVKK